MSKAQNHIILFDGYCNLCSNAVHFVIKRDPKQKFKFAALDSDQGRTLLAQQGLSAQAVDSIVLIRENNYYLKSSAALYIAKALRGLWPIVSIFLIVPLPIRDYFYDQVAKRRYHLWGKKEVCMRSIKDAPERFL